MGIFDFLKQPDVTLIQALLLKFKPVNMDVLPLYIVLLVGFPPILWLLLRRRRWRSAASAALYALTWHFDWNLPAYPSGTWWFNPFAWQLLFVFGAWCALGGAERSARSSARRSCLRVAVAYLVFAFAIVHDLVLSALAALRAEAGSPNGCIRSTRPTSTCCASPISWRWRW